MKKNNTAEKTIRNAEQITKALKERSEKSLKDLMNEAIANLIKEDDNADEEDIKDDEENSYDVNDVNADIVDSDETQDAENADEGGEEGAEDATDADDEWSDMEQYKVGDNDYDFTGVDGETALKVYNKLGDDDQIFIKKDEDGNYEVKDEETGAEYVIELNADDEDDNAESDNVNADFDFGTDAEDGDDTTEFSLEIGDDDDADDNAEEGDDDTSFDIEIEDDGEESSDEDESLNEDQNMVVNDYQKKTAMTLPSDKGETSGTDSTTFNAGAPKNGENSDSTRPYGKRGDDAPFDEKVNECGNAENTANLQEDGQGLNTKHKMVKSTNHINKDAQNQHVVSEPNDATVKALRESAKKIYERAKEIQAENKKYAACIDKLKKSIYEAATLNVNMGQVIKLLVNETTTANEKKTILERFNNVKTIKEGKTLYETIKRELNEAKKNAIVLEKQISAKSSDTLNETTIYQNKTKNPSLDLMERMDNLFK